MEKKQKISEQPITNGLKAKGDAIKRFSLLLHYLLEFVFLFGRSVGRMVGWSAGRSVCVHIWPALTHLLIPPAHFLLPLVVRLMVSNQPFLSCNVISFLLWLAHSALMCLRFLHSFFLYFFGRSL